MEGQKPEVYFKLTRHMVERCMKLSDRDLQPDLCLFFCLERPLKDLIIGFPVSLQELSSSLGSPASKTSEVTFTTLSPGPPVSCHSWHA